MKAILAGLSAMILSVLAAVLVQDLTPSVFLVPLGIYSIIDGIRHGDKNFEFRP